MYDRPKLVGRLLALKQRCTGKGDIGGIRQGLAHPLMRLAAVAAMPFVNKDNHVLAFVAAFRKLRRCVELVDDSEDDAFGTFADTPCKLPAR